LLIFGKIFGEIPAYLSIVLKFSMEEQYMLGIEDERVEKSTETFTEHNSRVVKKSQPK
jgi:hypothetical protein